ncbi:2-oxoacid:acceptor oxidoreductase family protein [uncultured Ilyobacter sp.]|uniref:2-oxoacid:acceptor oxidoreductase family protein n=1 Tax=uncultured Ilyobacter sp. TaxID=544433 RepID=UPI0029C7D222|nr:2-oxoacid:acceptor oxidoreductase family protein [uncultured Ilyobacter sp.]
MTKEIRLSGSGGQGLILAGIILAEAALKQGKVAVQSQSYGPEARGGASKSEVIISDTEILYPKVNKADIFLSLTQKSFDSYGNGNKENCSIVIDSSVKVPEGLNVIQLPILETAKEKVGNVIVANIVSLGAIQAATNIVDRDILEETILGRVPAHVKELNKRAFQAGIDLVKNF